jgi:hypothetical protein
LRLLSNCSPPLASEFEAPPTVLKIWFGLAALGAIAALTKPWVVNDPLLPLEEAFSKAQHHSDKVDTSVKKPFTEKLLETTCTKTSQTCAHVALSTRKGDTLMSTVPLLPFRNRLFSLHHDWGWSRFRRRADLGRRKLTQLGRKRKIDQWASSGILSCSASSYPGAFPNASGFGIYGSSFVVCQNYQMHTGNGVPPLDGQGDPNSTPTVEELLNRIRQLERQVEVMFRAVIIPVRN